ncbi:MAG: ATP-binding cassette domain-containing protein [Chitinophagaceae bacterium]
MDRKILEVIGLTQKLNNKTVLDHLSFSVRPGECWAITGASGSGKTALARALAGQNFVQGHISYDLPERFGPHPSIAFVEQQHQFRDRSGTANFYYQQRYNSFDAEDSLTVGEYLETVVGSADITALLEPWGLICMSGKPLIQLSNGENKRLQLAIALSGQPAVIILDNPFTGLDTAGRDQLDSLLARIIATGVLVIITTRTSDLPAVVTHLLVLDRGRMIYQGERSGYTPAPIVGVALPHLAVPDLPDLPDSIISMKNVSVRYGDKTILENINWEVRKGEMWSVSGPNGAGKSTLLSLITGDNPQVYANDVSLFGRKRGTGETIWEIKKRIGYVSPELHLSFDLSNTALEVTASGLFDTIGLFRQLNEEELRTVKQTLEWMGLSGVERIPMNQLSSGQQRLVLLARAIVKHPPLLILDEPCQGLDDEQSFYIRQIVEKLCESGNTTLIYISHYLADLPRGISHYLRLDRGHIQDN